MSGKYPNISVVLPVYNGMKFLQQSVESVLNQDIQNFELLICDDCSRDGSYEYLQSIDDKRVKLFRNEQNRGLFPTLNFLIKKSTAPLIHLWAQDDIMLQNCLRETVAFHEQFPEVHFSFSRLQGIDASGKKLKTPNTFPHKTLSPEGHAISSILYGSISGNIANVCIVKKAIEKAGYFDENMIYVGDFKMWCLLSKDKPIGMNGKILVHVRQHSGQLSKQLEASYNKLCESREVHSCFLQTLKPKLRKQARKALNWKIIPVFFTQYLFILRRGNRDLAKRYRKKLSLYGFMPLLFFRWAVVRLLRAAGKEQWFHQKFVIKPLLKKRKS